MMALGWSKTLRTAITYAGQLPSSSLECYTNNKLRTGPLPPSLPFLPPPILPYPPTFNPPMQDDVYIHVPLQTDWQIDA